MTPLKRLAGYPRFFLSAHPVWTLVETWLLGLLTLFVLWHLAGRINANALSNGTLLLCGVCGIWAVLRTRVRGGAWWAQILSEAVVGMVLSVTLAGGLGGAVWLFGWQAVWWQSAMDEWLGPALLALIGPGYLAARIAIRIWLWWGAMRRRRMRWSLTHAHLVVVLIVLAALQVLVFVAAVLGSTRSPSTGQVAWFVLLAEQLLHTVLPAAGIALVFSGFALLVALPPSALFSFLVVRRTTRRLEALAGAASALREGDYAARVEVSGEDEVAQLQADFNAMAGELQRTLDDLQAERDTVAGLLRSRRDLAATVSHELRTPVATVRAALESALDRWQEAPPPSLREDLQVIEGEVLRLQRLIDDLFALAQADAGGLALELVPADVAPIVQRMVDALAPWAWQSGRVEVVAELPGVPGSPLHLAVVDAARLEQILANLVRNAVRHTPPGGIVVVAAAGEAQAVRIEVRDTGDGIAPEDLPHIWERFYRGREAGAHEVVARDRAARGAGLGLALVKELTEAMGGAVEVESALGQGSCFTLRIPKA